MKYLIYRRYKDRILTTSVSPLAAAHPKGIQILAFQEASNKRVSQDTGFIEKAQMAACRG
jgi:hypothetical protein